MIVGSLFSDTFLTERASKISFPSSGVIGNACKLACAGRLDMIPSNYSAFCAELCLGPPPRRRGLGSAGASRRRAAQRQPLERLCDRRHLPRAPCHRRDHPDAIWTCGAEWPDEMRIHLPVAARHPPVELPSTLLDDVSRRLAAQAANLIADCSALQFGSARSRM